MDENVKEAETICESCPYNNNGEWNERSCPMKFVGMCWRNHDEAAEKEDRTGVL